MDTAEIAVVIGGMGLIILVLWFFFGSREATTATAGAGEVQQVEVLVKSGYTPDLISVLQGRPVRLLFRREDANPCTEQVVLGDFGITRQLPVGKTVPIEFTPTQTGEFAFTCGMNMVRGRLLVREE